MCVLIVCILLLLIAFYRHDLLQPDLQRLRIFEIVSALFCKSALLCRRVFFTDCCFALFCVVLYCVALCCVVLWCGVVWCVVMLCCLFVCSFVRSFVRSSVRSFVLCCAVLFCLFCSVLFGFVCLLVCLSASATVCF